VIGVDLARMQSITTADPDAAIRLTDGDAAVARLSAVQKHYLQDPYVKYFVPRAHLQPPKPALINIGTFVRSTAIDDLVHRWLLSSEHDGKRCQIVSMGAGSDTRFWRIAVSDRVHCR
jgi:[phosphatase 2A protein]-leucine-carboxy methyltransferase